MIQYLCGQEKNKCRKLWEAVFWEDSASFTDYYFEQVLPRNRVLADMEGGQVRSMIHLNPYEIKARNSVWNAEYLVGVATCKEYRHQGYMRKLMLRVLTDLRGERMPFCFLMPVDKDIYEPFDFTYIMRKTQRELDKQAALLRRSAFPREKEEVGKKAGERAESFRRALSPAEISTWQNDWLARHYQVFSLRGEDYLRRLMSEIVSEDGSFDLLYHDGCMVGMESVWGLDKREQRFLYGDAPYVTEIPTKEPLIMARILNLEEFVKVIRLRENVHAKEMLIPLVVEDRLLEENNGAWIWHLDHEASWLERGNISENQMNTSLRLRIDELTAWLFDYHIPNAAIKYRGVVDVLQGVLLDEVV